MTNLATLNSADLWRCDPHNYAGLATVTLIGAGLIVNATGPTLRPPFSAAAVEASLPPPITMSLRSVVRDEAIRINGAIPLAGPAGTARPFVRGTASSMDQGRALECLTSAIYYEAGQEPTDGQRAVAQAILNRVRHPAFPSSVCGVVYQGSTRQTGCQFTFTCDGSMARVPMQSSWDRARKVAAAALAGSVYPNVGNATHYHADYVVPYWASSLAKTAVVGAHLFYRWSGGWGLPKAFGQSYSGREADPQVLRSEALSIVDLPPIALPRVSTITVPAVTQLVGAMVLTETDTKGVQALFSPKGAAKVEKAGHKLNLVRIAKFNNPPWTLAEGAPIKTETATGMATSTTGESTNAN